jgi:transcriptional regulator with XRE-family HTH domain
LDIGRRIKQLRKGRGLQQDQLAKRIGSSNQYVWMLESGTRVPSIAMLVKIADGLAVAPAELLKDPQPDREEIAHSEAHSHPEPRVRAEHLRDVCGFPLNDTEVIFLNQELLLHENPPSPERFAVTKGYVKKKDEPVRTELVAAALAFAVRNLYTPAEAQAFTDDTLSRFAVAG